MKQLIAILFCFIACNAFSALVKVATQQAMSSACWAAAESAYVTLQCEAVYPDEEKIGVRVFLSPPVFDSYSVYDNGLSALQPAWDGDFQGRLYKFSPGQVVKIGVYVAPQLSGTQVVKTFQVPSLPPGVTTVAGWEPPPFFYSQGYTPPPTVNQAAQASKAEVDAKRAAAAALPAGSTQQAAAQVAYEAAKNAYEALLEQQQGVTAQSAAATTKANAATTATTALGVVSTAQAAGSTGEAVAASGKATVAAIDALRAEQALSNQKLIDAVKAGGAGGGTTNNITNNIDNTGVEGRLDTANGHLSKLTDAALASEAGKAEAAGRVSAIQSAVDGGEATANAAAAGVTAEVHGAAFGRGASAANGWGAGAAAAPPTAYVPMADVALNFPGGAVVIPVDPVRVLTDWGLMSFIAVARSLIVLAVCVGVYRWLLASCSSLVSNLFASESAHTAITQTGTAGGSFIAHLTASASFSFIKPILSASRLALLLALPVAIVGIIDAYLSSVGSSSTGLLSGINSGYSALLAAGGRGIYILNLLIPLPTVIFSGIYASLALSIIYSVFVVAKGKSAALQSV